MLPYFSQGRLRFENLFGFYLRSFGIKLKNNILYEAHILNISKNNCGNKLLQRVFLFSRCCHGNTNRLTRRLYALVRFEKLYEDFLLSLRCKRNISCNLSAPVFPSISLLFNKFVLLYPPKDKKYPHGKPRLQFSCSLISIFRFSEGTTNSCIP